MADIVSYVNGTGDLNEDYGTWEVIGGNRVKFTLSGTAVALGTGLQNGKFATTANVRDLGSDGTTGKSVVEGVDVEWEFRKYPPSNAGYNGYPTPMYKGVWPGSGNQVGTFHFIMNTRDYVDWFTAVANGGDPSTAYTEKTNVVIVDELSSDLQLTSNHSFEIVMRGPHEKSDGTIVPGNGEVHSLKIEGCDGVKITQTPGQTYDEFYDAVVVDGTAPCYGIYDEKVIIINLGSLPSEESFLEMYNRLFEPATPFTSMRTYLESVITEDKFGFTAAQRVENWLDTDVYTDDMKVWTYTFNFNARANWLASDVDNQTKTIANEATMSYDGGKYEDSTSMDYHRTTASIELTPGELYVVKVDAKTGDPIPGVKFLVQEYTGGKTNIDDVRADTDEAYWDKKVEKTTGADGVFRWQGNVAKFYKIVEIEAASGYDIDSFEIFNKNGDSLPDGIFAMPIDAGIIIIAENTLNPEAAEISLVATKKLTGRLLKADEFTFELYDDSDNLVDTAQNDVDGKITFGPITYDKIGSYEYTIKELRGSASGITYDKAEFTVTVEVTDNGDGKLIAEAIYPREGVAFENIYDEPTTPGGGGGGGEGEIKPRPPVTPEEPEEPETPETPETPSTSGEEPPALIDIGDGDTPTGAADPAVPSSGDAPQTGDTNNIIGLCVLALLAIVGLMVIARRKNETI